MPVEVAQDVPFGQLARHMSRMLERMGKNYSNFAPGETWHPNVNLYESTKSYLVCVDLAGVERKQIDLQVIDQRLILRGRREVPACPEDIEAPDCVPIRARLHLLEIDYGPFSRDIDLPEDADTNHIHAAYRNGWLWVEVPKVK